MRAHNIEPSNAGACVAVPNFQCNPIMDTESGENRVCVCVNQMDAVTFVQTENTAYLDRDTCYCKGGWTQDPANTALCTRETPLLLLIPTTMSIICLNKNERLVIQNISELTSLLVF